jgi:putative cardiolipin synthase
MHNKSFTADSQATIVGGRNIGDEYFGAGDGVLFADLDVIAVGPVVTEVSSDFDRYWASESSYPVGLLLPAADPEQLTRLATSASLVERSPAAASYVQAIRESNFIGQMLEGSLTFQWSPTRLVSDDPAKGLGRAEPEALLPFQLHEIIGVPRSDVELVSPYFVPTQAGVEAFVALAQMGVKVRILTNSLDATDVAAVHSGYAKHRRALLEAGIELYEMRRLNPEMDKRKRTGPFGSSGSSLHAKTFAVDRQRVFVGSFNFDPRSVNLNTELGLIIDNPVLAGQIDDMFNSDIARTAYEVRLTDDGTLYWIEQVGGQDVYHAREPGTTVWQRLGVSVLALLPIDWLL